MADKDCRYCGGAGKFQITSSVSDGAWVTCFCSRTQYPTEDAYMRVCRALRWRTAELKANGIEPVALNDDSPHDPPEGYDFGVSGKQSDREVAIAEHAFRAGFHEAVDMGAKPEDEAEAVENAWGCYTPPEFD